MVMEVRNEGAFEIALMQIHKIKIKKFLEKLNKIPFGNPKSWEAEIFKFFSEELIVPYVVLTTMVDDDELINNFKDYFLGDLINGKIIHWDSNQCYQDLIKIRESINTGTSLNEYAKFFLVNNNLLRRMFVKSTDSEDARFQEFGPAIIPYCHEITTKSKMKYYESVYFVLPDHGVDYPTKEWHYEILKDWNVKLKTKLNITNAKPKKRDPIESRLRHEVFKRDNYKCLECGKTNKNTTLHVDHIIPVAQNGTDELDNLQTLCQACNLAKSNRAFKGGKQK